MKKNNDEIKGCIPDGRILSDDELDKVAGGGDANSKYCICDHFVPEDGNWNNKTYSNCHYGISAKKYSVLCPGNPN